MAGFHRIVFMSSIALAGCAPEAAPEPTGAPLRVSLEPAAPTARDSLQLVVDGTADIRWSVDGSDVPEHDGALSLPAGTLVRGQTWTVVVSTATNAPATASVSVVNAAPTISVTLPPTVLPSEDLVPVIEVDDPDDDTIDHEWTWTRDGRQLPGFDERVPSVETAKSERWTVSVVARDGRVVSEAASAEVRIGNTPPQALGIALSPAEPTVQDAIIATPRATDADDDPLSWTWTWIVDGNEIGVQDSVLPAGTVQRGQTVLVRAVPHDGDEAGPQVESDTIVVANAAPTVSTVQLTPSSPSTTDTLRCTATAADADGDAVDLRTIWWVDGVATQSATLPPGTARGTDVRCDVIASDGTSDSTPATASTTIVNAPPALAGITMAPAAPTVQTELTAQVDGPTDPDGDTVSWTLHWTIDGQAAGTGPTLPAGRATRGQIVEVWATPSDGFETGATARTSAAVLNAVPTLSTILVPDARATDPIVADIDATDPDGDALLWTWTFAVDGTVVQSGPSDTLLPGQHVGGQQVRVSAIADDGHGGVAQAPPTVTTVLNSAPTPPTARVSPTPAVVGRDGLTCEVVLPADDPDGDGVTYRATWQVDGQEFLGSVTETHHPGDTVPAAALEAGEHWSCTLIASDGEDESAAAPVSTIPVDATAARQLALGDAHSCKVDHLDRLSCWGDNSHAQSSPQQGTWSTVATGVQYTCALDELGAIACWGTGSVPLQPPAGSFSSLAGGDDHACVTDADDLVTCWGNTFFGQHLAPDIPLTSLAAGTVHTCGLDSSGAIECWGADFGGVLSPPAGSWSSLASGPSHLCALDADGQAACWGIVPAQLPAGSYSDLGLALDTTCAIRTDGTLVCVGDNPALTRTPAGTFVDLAVGDAHACARTEALDTVCWGVGDSGQLTPLTAELQSITVGGGHACALDLDGIVRCWGTEGQGQTSAPAGSYDKLASGLEFSCALDAAGAMTCWGDDSCLQANSPAGVWTDFDLGDRHGCAVDETGAVTCWGHDDAGQAQSPTGTFTAVAAGGTHSCGIHANDTVTCWGQPLPPPPAGAFASISAGVHHTCGLRANGIIRCWGLDPAAQQAPMGSFAAVSAGNGLSCALDAAGTATCWGRNDWQQSTTPEVAFQSIDVEGDYVCGVSIDSREHCWGRLRR